MRHFDFLNDEITEDIFYKTPNEINYDDNKDILTYALGGTLYIPGIRRDIDKIILGRKYPELSSLVICLEDSICDNDLEQAEKNIKIALLNIKDEISNGHDKSLVPLIFIRVRNPEHLLKVASLIKESSEIVVGFAFPKFDEIIGVEFIKNLDFINERDKSSYYFMPILESKNIIYKEKRMECLSSLAKLFSENRDKIINIRIGSTDFSSYFGLRRNRDFTAYDIHVIRDCISDILNFFTRDEERFTISGSVWEYFEKSERILKPQLRQTIFRDHLGEEGKLLRQNLIKENFDGLIREVMLDKENGIIGKTVIHPSHISLVNAMYVVTHEEYMDAICIINSDSNGVIKSDYNNKMNEIKPHEKWAKKILKRAYVYGVYNIGRDFISLLSYTIGGDIDKNS